MGLRLKRKGPLETRELVGFSILMSSPAPEKVRTTHTAINNASVNIGQPAAWPNHDSGKNRSGAHKKCNTIPAARKDR